MPLTSTCASCARRLFRRCWRSVSGTSSGWIFYDQISRLPRPTHLRPAVRTARPGRAACGHAGHQRHRRPVQPAAQGRRRRRPGARQPGLALPALGASSPRGCTATSGAGRSRSSPSAVAVVPRRARRSATSCCRRLTTLLLGFTPDERRQHRRLQRLPLVRPAADARLRHRLPDAASSSCCSTSAGILRRRRLRRLVAPDRVRLVRVRRGRHPHRRPVHDDRARRAVWSC